MYNSLTSKLRKISERHAEVEAQLALTETAQDPIALKRLGREYSTLSEMVQLWQRYEKLDQELIDLREMVNEEEDLALKELAIAELEMGKAEVVQLTKEIQEALLPSDEADTADAMVEIRAGTGGDEAGLFAYDLYRMYARYAERKGWKIAEISRTETDLGGVKELIFEVAGNGAYRDLKLESGVHRVQRIPTTESQGRLHTSAATIAVLPKAQDLDITIAPEDVRTDIFHASGAGGQNVNKVATAIRLTHLPTGMVVTCQNERSQLQNRLKAMEVLKTRLWDAEIKRREEKTAAERKAQVGGGDRSEKIRTYNFPQNRVTDHRVGVTSYNLQRVLDGELGEFVRALQTDARAKKLAAITEDN